MFERKIYNELKKWKNENNGKTALLIEGARRVGKSTIAKYFAQKEYKSYILIDFANITPSLLSVFEDISNLDLFFIRLQTETNITLYERKSIIIFDEIQLFPKARQAIKYLVQDGRYDYIETGSLISIKKNVDGILLPSEEKKIEMYPLDFEEFSNAVGFNYDILKSLYLSHHSIGEATNRSLIRNFRIYMAVGGMPQAVQAYIDQKNFNEIDNIKKDIINLYLNDLRKIDKTGRLSKIFETIPAQLVAKKNRFSFNFSIGKKLDKDNERLFDLLDSKIAYSCYCLNDIQPSLNLYADLTKYKLYVADTGLFVTMLFNSDNKEHEEIYKKLLSNKLDLNLGYLYENVAAQLIASSGTKLYYFTFRKESNTHSYEIDFLLSKKNKVIPLEIKSGRITTHASLDAFGKKYSKYVAEKYIISSKDYFKDKDVTNLPYYLLPFIL